MKKYIFLSICILFLSCSNNKGVFWCGDHPCINKNEKKAYFKKTMIVEVKNFNKDSLKNDSEIEKLLERAKLNEKKRILEEKRISKQAKIEEKERLKRAKLQEKKRIKEEKELEKQIKLEEKERAEKIKDSKKKAKAEKKKTDKKKVVKIISENKNVEITTEKFENAVDQIIKRNSSRSYPDINDIPK